MPVGSIFYIAYTTQGLLLSREIECIPMLLTFRKTWGQVYSLLIQLLCHNIVTHVLSKSLKLVLTPPQQRSEIYPLIFPNYATSISTNLVQQVRSGLMVDPAAQKRRVSGPRFDSPLSSNFQNWKFLTGFVYLPPRGSHAGFCSVGVDFCWFFLAGM